MKKILSCLMFVLLVACGKVSESPNVSGGGIETGGVATGGIETGGDTGGTETGGETSGGEEETPSAGASGLIVFSGAAGTATSGASGSSGFAGASGVIQENEGGRTFDVGTGGTLDVGSGGTLDVGTGGTLDLGTGGTLDLGTGGTIDLGTGGTIDLGTGGTTDTCIPTCVPDLLGFGEDAVNLVIFENAVASGCDTEGRMWVGGDATLSGYGVGAQLEECDTENYVLVVGGSLDVSGGIKGKIWVGGEMISGTPQCGGVWDEQPPPVDFAEIESTLQSYSLLLAGYPINGSTEVGTPTRFVGVDEDVNVFSISGSDFTVSNGFVIDVPVVSTVIINVTGDSAGFVNGTTTLPDGVVCGSGAVKLDDFCNQLIWNFPEATTISVSGTAVQGSILAPFADFAANGSGQVNGTVIVNNFEIDACVEMHPHYFNGCLCTEEINSPYACCP